MAQQNYLPSGLDLAKINPAELPLEALTKYQETIQEQIKALEERYKEPNWFKVAAGFAKPQLGGFFASLGSAAEALGENVEKEREQMLPIAQMKIAVNQANIIIGQRQLQNQLFQEWLDKNTKPDGSVQPMDAVTYSRIYRLDPTSPAALAATKYYEGARAGLDIAMTAAEGAQRLPLIADNLQKLSLQFMSPSANAEEIDNANKRMQENLKNAGQYLRIDPAIWNNMTDDAKLNTIAKGGQEQMALGLNNEASMQKQARQSEQILPTYAQIRDLALGTGLKPIQKVNRNTGQTEMLDGQKQMEEALGIFRDPDVMSAFFRALTDGRIAGGKFQGLDEYVKQGYMTREAADNFQVLVKNLASIQMQMRGSLENPSNAMQELVNLGSPNVGNSQKALVQLIDLLALKERKNIDSYEFMVNNDLSNAKKMFISDPYKQKFAQYVDLSSQVATSDPTLKRPWFYTGSAFSRPSQQATSESSVQATTSAAPSAPSATPPAKPSAPSATPPAKPSISQERPNRTKGFNGNEWVRVGNKWEDTGKPFK